MRRDGHQVVVVGSLNVDYIASVERLPIAGQTVAASKLVQRFGGKGANQAVAAARQGAQVAMIGCVGADDSGRAYIRRLRQEQIDARNVLQTGRALTGTALIAVDRHGENLIVVAPGANAHVSASSVRKQRRKIGSAKILLVQFEIPMPSVVEAIRVANEAGVPVVLNPSPFQRGFPWGRLRIDTLITNEGETEAIFGQPVSALRARNNVWRRAIARHGVARLIVTRGAQKTLCLTATECYETPTLPVRPVDTVGAGDAFAGTVAACLAAGETPSMAIRYANCAGALATLKPGAQEAMPSRSTTTTASRRLGQL